MMRLAQSSLPDLRGVVCAGQNRGGTGGQLDRVAVLEGRLAPGTVLAVLADRLGARSSDALMADNLVLAAQQCFDRFSPAEESPQAFFAVLIDQVHTVVRLAAVAAASTPRSSFAAVLVQPDRIDWCQVGSTRIYHFRDAELLHCAGDPRAYGVQPPNVATATALPTLRGAAELPVNHLGSRQPPVPALGRIDDPCSGDSILLCSDGVWSSLDDEVLTETVALGTCSEATRGLLHAASQQANDASCACSLVLIGLGRET